MISTRYNELNEPCSVTQKINNEGNIAFYLVHFGTEKNPMFKVNAILKYKSMSGDRITIEHNCKIFSKLNNLLANHIENYVEINPNLLNLKVSGNQLKERVRALQLSDMIEVVIKFNNCWCLNNMIYCSFCLVDVKEINHSLFD